jgi:excisionase family DNA binding protein
MGDELATVTRQEACDLLGASDRTLRRLIQEDRIRAVRGLGADQVLSRDDVMRQLQAADATISQVEAADRLGVTKRTIARMLRDGRLDGVRTPGGHLRPLAASVSSHAPAETGQTLAGQKPDTTGHEPDKLDRTRHEQDVSGSVQRASDDDDEYVPLLDLPLATAPGLAARRRRGAGMTRRLAVAAAAIAVVAGGAAAIVAHGGDGTSVAGPRASTVALTLPSIGIVAPPRRPHPARTGQPAKTGHPARPARKPVRHTTTAAPRPAVVIDSATVRPPAAKKTRPTAKGSVCKDLYGAEGIC